MVPGAGVATGGPGMGGGVGAIGGRVRSCASWHRSFSEACRPILKDKVDKLATLLHHFCILLRDQKK